MVTFLHVAVGDNARDSRTQSDTHCRDGSFNSV